jgi:hypothetical protein
VSDIILYTIWQIWSFLNLSIMKFTIEVDDFWLEDSELEPALKKFVTDSVIVQINQSIKAKVEEAVTKEVKAQVEQTLYRKIGTFVTECIANDKIKGHYSNTPELTLQEWVKTQFVETARSKAPIDDKIRTLAAAFGEEMKKRYDLLFASQLVAKMKDSGFLKDEAVQLLLTQ